MIQIPNFLFLLCAAFVIMLVATWLMRKQSQFFFTKDPVRRKFSILEMEFPVKSFDLEYLIKGIHDLPDEADKTVTAVHRQLLVGSLLFIPALYGSIYILCMHVAVNVETPAIGRWWFVMLGWAQLVSLLLDYVENIYFWRMVGNKNIVIPKPDLSKPEIAAPSFKMIQILEIVKWGIVLIGFVCSISVMAYFWLIGNY
ncbi:hypothetical protein [Taibaiella soli]|uniref:Uncharacterized protein n=1 Tax=Taibaiella soli TaxID=1649169 RepID=A0A2W2APN3_9BACT|nr:hypothetical protein [Taibaiella soli]PZF74360.1 hypothetical protein DN068_01915 [Taibaiella soli]